MYFDCCSADFTKLESMDVIANDNENLKENNIILKDTDNFTVKENIKSTEEKTEKEKDDWELVEASSNESEASVETDIDIKIPVKLIEKQARLTAHGISVKSSSKDTSDKSSFNLCIQIGSDTEKSTQETSHESVSSNTVHTQPCVGANQQTSKSSNSNVVKKRKFRLYTGDSDDEIISKENANNKKTETENGNKTDGNHPIAFEPQSSVQNKNQPQEKNQVTSKNNETFTIDKPKFHSDSEITDENSTARRQKYHVIGNSSKEAKLCYISEESDDDIVEVPCSPHAKNYNLSPSRKLPTDRERKSNRHACQCNSAALISSPSSKRAKRQKLMEHMWQKRERKLKLKMVSKVKDVFYQVLESLVSSSDESEDSSMSDDKERHACKISQKKKQYGNYGRNVPHTEHHQESDNIRDLKRELQYWKNKATNNSEMPSPREIQMREMKADLNYWKRMATSKPRTCDMPSSSHSIPRTSTPEKQDEIFSERPLPRPLGTFRVSSSADTSVIQPRCPSPSQSFDRLGTADYLHDETEPGLNKKKENPFQRENYKPPATANANCSLSVMSRTKFTEKEKDEIVKYLTANYDRLELLRGNMFWIQMEHDMNTHRSWHSLKNNFFTNIMKNLEQYEMPNKVRNKIITLAKQYM